MTIKETDSVLSQEFKNNMSTDLQRRFFANGEQIMATEISEYLDPLCKSLNTKEDCYKLNIIVKVNEIYNRYYSES